MIRKIFTHFIDLCQSILAEPKRRNPGNNKPKLNARDLSYNDFYNKLIFVEYCGHHKILKHPSEDSYFIKKRKVKAHRKNRSKLILDSNKNIKKFKSLDKARQWVGRRWAEKSY